jgi:exodeoxyribonuclease V gamma subunit
LIITYIGQSISHNETIPPSVVISELLEVLEESYQLSDLITRHPLQPFSPRYFNGTPDLFSFSEADCETARALSAPKPAPALWWQDIHRNILASGPRQYDHRPFSGSCLGLCGRES